MMQVIAAFLVMSSVCQSPVKASTERARAEQDFQGLTVANQLKGMALVACVRAGMGPGQIQRMFGSPLLYSRFRDGPEEWWYPNLGVTVYFPVKPFRPTRTRPLTPERIHGGII
jgi:hypothetical protein